MSEGREPESSFASENIRRRGRDADVKRESERKEEKFGLLLLSSYLYPEDNTLTNQNPGSWHSNSHTSPSLRASCLTIQAPAVMNSWRKQQEHLLTWCTFPNVPQSINLNIYTQHSLHATAAQSLYAKLVKCLINMHHKAHEGSVKLGMWSCVSHCLVCWKPWQAELTELLRLMLSICCPIKLIYHMWKRLEWWQAVGSWWIHVCSVMFGF